MDATGARRDRIVWVVDKREGRVFSTAVANLCAERDFYTVAGDDPRIIDKMWSGYESGLSGAIDDLIAAKVDAMTWAATLVPFVTALLVRGRDFAKRFESRFIVSLGTGIPPLLREGPDNTNWARLMEMQRLRASVLGARWTVIEVAGSTQLITNDLGFNAHIEPKSQYRGIVVPLGLHHALTVLPTKERHVVATAKNGAWIPNISYARLDDDQSEGINKCFSISAQRFIIGPTEEVVSRYRRQQEVPPGVPEPGALGFMSGRMARQYEHVYLNLMSKMAVTPPEDGLFLYVDYKRNMKAAGP